MAVITVSELRRVSGSSNKVLRPVVHRQPKVLLKLFSN